MNYNYVEEKVDTSMIDRLELKYPGVKGKISKASRHSKRMAIASILGNREIFELIKKTLDLQKSDEYLTNLDELVVLFRKYVEVADVEKKTLGEVMTPITLVEQMLDTLPSEVWSNPNLKWLDPCAGVGTFPSIVVQRLMKGLKKVIPNPEKRYGHIIENMIYVCELQDKNLFVFNCVFDLGDNNATNSYCGSFLDENFDKHMSDVWGVEKFDIIIGNPPYNSSKEGQFKTQAIWHKFVEKSILILCEGGYLNMVHPSGWRNADGMFKGVQDLFKQRNLLYLEIHDTNDGLKVFNAGTRFDWYVLKNTKNENLLTTIKCQDGILHKLDISKLEFIPNGRFDDIMKLYSKENRVKLTHSFSLYESRKNHMSKKVNEEFKYPCLQNINVNNEPSCVYYSNTKEYGHFNIPKLIFGVQVSGLILDNKGEFGMCQHCSAIIDEVNNLEQIKMVMESKEFIELMKYCDVGGNRDRYNRRVISTFRKDFYKQFLNN